MSKKSGIILCALCAVAIGLSVAALAVAVPVLGKQAESQTDTQYVLYLGTNDKDTNEPVFDMEEAKNKAEEILFAHFGGHTMQEAHGGWKDGDIVYRENTLVIYLSDTNIEEIHSAADEMITVFHQSSVLIQRNKTITEFYSGK